MKFQCLLYSLTYCIVANAFTPTRFTIRPNLNPLTTTTTTTLFMANSDKEVGRVIANTMIVFALFGNPFISNAVVAKNAEVTTTGLVTTQLKHHTT